MELRQRPGVYGWVLGTNHTSLIFCRSYYFFLGLRTPNDRRRPVTGGHRFGKVGPVITGPVSFLCLSGVWETYFLLPPVAVEVAKNMFSHMDQLALIYDIIHLREVVLHSGLVTQMGHKTDEGLKGGTSTEFVIH